MEVPPFVLQVVQLIGYVVVVVFFILKINTDVRILRVKMEGINGQLDILNQSFLKLGDILTQIAVQDSEISNLKQDLNELRHGRGWYADVNGEYTLKGKVDNRR